jgi:hypothetical protein
VSAPAEPTAPAVRDPSGSWPGATGPRSRQPRRWWLFGAVTGWALLLVVVAVVSRYRDRPTVPEQRDVAAAMPAVNRAAGAVLAAVGPDRVFAVGPLVVRPDCRVTPVRPGAAVTREITVHARAGEAPAILDAIGAALPASYGAEVTHRRGGTVHTLWADAGDFIAVRGTVSGGVITLRAESGCRPLNGPVPAAAPPSPAAGSPALAAVLSALDLAGRSVATTRSVACPGGTTASTVTVDGTPAPADLGTALRPVTAGATVVEADPTRYAFLTDATAVVVAVAGGGVRVTASTGC